MNTQLPTKLLLFLVLSLWVGCTPKETSLPTETKTPPNIIFIMADDHTTQGIGAYGSRLAQFKPYP